MVNQEYQLTRIATAAALRISLQLVTDTSIPEFSTSSQSALIVHFALSDTEAINQEVLRR